jgi:GTP-binding protein Era
MPRSGFVAISGQPNVGKSTLLNGFLGEKVAIVSEKPETTRDNIRGILTMKDCQITFIDTPGLHKPHDLLGKMMVTRAQSTIMETDLILFVTERNKAFGRDDMSIIARLPTPQENKKVIMVINKVDTVKDKKTLLPIMEKALTLYPFAEVVPVSALNKKDIEKLLDIIKSYLPKGPFFYPDDQLTDREPDFMIQEIIREKILNQTYEEIPHAIAVVVDVAEEDEEKRVFNIYATIFVERPSQKGIIIGKSGAMIKRITDRAKSDIEKFLDRKVNIELWVKVREKWKKDPNALKEMGYSD